MIEPFEAPRIKIERAKRHLQELQTEVSAYFRRGGAQVVFELADEYTEGVGLGDMGAYVYRERESVPTAWSAIIGDVIHNLRASLDLAASDIHRVTGGNLQDRKHVHYPFCKEQSELNTMIRSRRLNQAGRDYLDIIEQTAPYKGGNDGLRAVHDLDLLDKHQALLPTIAVVKMDWPVKINEGPQQFATGVMKEGQRIMIFPRSFCPLPLGSQMKADFSIIFGEAGAFRGTDVDRQLNACIAAIETIVGLFRSVHDKKAASKPVGP